MQPTSASASALRSFAKADQSRLLSAQPQATQRASEVNGPVVIYGPQGCGKTRNADALMKHYGKTVVYDYEPGMRPLRLHPARALILTDIELPGSIPFAMAMRAAGLQW